MTQHSMFWSTNNLGDGTAYTQENWFTLLRNLFLAEPENQGVLAGVGHELLVSGSASPLIILDGAALVYGIPYTNSENVSISVPTPTLGTTAHRLVLRASWLDQTVRLVLISSPDGVAELPALNQTGPGSLWEIPLASISASISGALAVTDERQFVKFQGALLSGRSGGAVADWNTPGSDTYLPGQALLQAGCCTCSAAGPNTISFPCAYTAKPLVFVTLQGEVTAPRFPSAKVVTASGFEAWVCDGSGAYVEQQVSWLAVGPKDPDAGPG